MEELEVVVFDEIDDYKEKIKGLTFRQWIFVGISILVVVPTYIFIPKFLNISKDIVSYIVIVEAVIIGFFGFIKIHNLNAEQIIPYWYRHYLIFNKPITYKTDKQWADEHTKKKDKKAQKVDADKQIKDVTSNIEATKPKDQPKISKKELKAQQKQEKMLAKAKKKYGYIFDKPETNKEIQKVSEKPMKNTKENQIQEDEVPNDDVRDIANDVKSDNHLTDIQDTKETTENMLMGMLTKEQKQQLLKALENENNS